MDRSCVESLEAKSREIGGVIGSCLPPDVGYVLLLFHYGDGDDRFLSYISNGRREDIARTMEEFLARWRDDGSVPPANVEIDRLLTEVGRLEAEVAALEVALAAADAGPGRREGSE